MLPTSPDPGQPRRRPRRLVKWTADDLAEAATDAATADEVREAIQRAIRAEYARVLRRFHKRPDEGQATGE
jgi:hypothetical protein